MMMKNGERELKTESLEVAEAWKQYCEKFYQPEEESGGNDGTEQETESLEYEQAPEI